MTADRPHDHGIGTDDGAPPGAEPDATLATSGHPARAAADDDGGGGTNGGILGRAHRALTLGIISVVSLVAFEASAVNTAMPVAARALDGIGLYAFGFSAFFTASLFAMALAGSGATGAGRSGRCSAGSPRSGRGC